MNNESSAPRGNTSSLNSIQWTRRSETIWGVMFQTSRANRNHNSKSVTSALQMLSIFQFSSCEKWEQWRNSVMDQTGRTLKINSHKLGWVRAPSLFILVRVSMGAQWWNQEREEKIKQSWTGQSIWLGLPWLQSAWMQINSTMSTQGGMQPFCLRFGEEVNTFISQLPHHSTTHGIEGGIRRGDCTLIVHNEG